MMGIGTRSYHLLSVRKLSFLLAIRSADETLPPLPLLSSSFSATTKHDYAKKCITFYFSPHKSDELLTFLHHEFSLDRTSIVYIEIE